MLCGGELRDGAAGGRLKPRLSPLLRICDGESAEFESYARYVRYAHTMALRIGLIAPPWFAVPPTGYGGVEWVVSNLAEGLVARGHEVTLFASGGSVTDARLVSTYDTPPSAQIGDWMVEAPAILDAYERWSEFDVIHDHSLLGLLMAAGVPVPAVHTVHGAMIPAVRPIYERVGQRVHMVAVSRHQRTTFPSGLSATVIHNTVDATRYPMGGGDGDYLLFVGRICAEKGILDAIEIARRSEKRLMVLAKINEAPEKAYFESVVRPALDGLHWDFLEQPPHDVKARAYADAYATLFPIAWPEPFGLVMVESMAAGTPVIAYRCGAVPEVVADGVNGFICENVDQAVDAVRRVPEIIRADCRQYVVEHFGVEKSVLAHEALYRQLLTRTSRPSNMENFLATHGA